MIKSETYLCGIVAQRSVALCMHQRGCFLKQTSHTTTNCHNNKLYKTTRLYTCHQAVRLCHGCCMLTLHECRSMGCQHKQCTGMSPGVTCLLFWLMATMPLPNTLPTCRKDVARAPPCACTRPVIYPTLHWTVAWSRNCRDCQPTCVPMQ